VALRCDLRKSYLRITEHSDEGVHLSEHSTDLATCSCLRLPRRSVIILRNGSSNNHRGTEAEKTGRTLICSRFCFHPKGEQKRTNPTLLVAFSAVFRIMICNPQ
jgi:hypothetical protein